MCFADESDEFHSLLNQVISKAVNDKKSILFTRGENVEEAFLETAKKIYESIQDGSLDLNAAESGVQKKPTANGARSLSADNSEGRNPSSCSC